MKVLHIPFCFYPDPVGGTEIYVEALARYQEELDMQPAIAAPAREDASYTHAGHPVYRYRTAKRLQLRELYGEGDPEAALSFSRVLEKEHPDIVHMHAFTSAISIRVVRAARDLGIPVVFTYHTATVSCARSTLLWWGKQPCDGLLDLHTCARCRLHSKGMPASASWLIGSLPSTVGSCVGKLGLSGSAWTALRVTELLRVRHSAVRALFSETASVVAVCEWTRRLLVRNGVAGPQLIRNGVDPAKLAVAKRRRRPSASATPLRIAFLGRIDAGKGLDVLLKAMQLAQDLPLRLDIFAVVQGEKGEALKRTLSANCGNDPRISFLPPLLSENTVDRLQDYDVLAMPSQAMEPGPLVIYEALAAGTPVAGSDLGGIPELIRHEENGLLVEPASPSAWAAALTRLVREPELLPDLKRGIAPVRTMRDVARDLQSLYRQVLTGCGTGIRTASPTHAKC